MEKIQKAYITYVLDKGEKPSSVYAFAKKLKMTEGEFYDHYNSFEQLENEIWTGFFKETKQKIESEAIFEQYTVREKVLAFYFTWFEVLKGNRSFVLLAFASLPKASILKAPQLASFKKAFIFYLEDLLAEGKESNEVKSRRFIDRKYPELFWAKTLWLLDFWVKDTSKGFESTDTAIEKAVNTAFELIGTTVVDSVVDLAKFIYQNR